MVRVVKDAGVVLRYCGRAVRREAGGVGVEGQSGKGGS